MIWVSVRSAAWAVLWLFLAAGTAFAERPVTDMMGRTVNVPDKVARVVTIGPVPVLNSFVFALGEAATIVNSPPPNLGGPRWWLQSLIAPATAHGPVVQSGDGPSVESVVSAAPDVVLTMDRRTVDLLARTRVPVIFLSWRQPEDVKAVIRLLGELYAKSDVAEAYCRYFDDVLTKIDARTATLRDDQRPRVLYGQLRRLSQPHQIAEWWIAKAGGRSVTNDGRSGEAFNFTIEQLLAWDPEVIVTANGEDVAAAYADKRLAGLAAIKNHRVYVVPMGAHLWGNRTAEQPLTVLWTAKTIYPELFADIDLRQEIAAFYRIFFKTELNADQVTDILESRARRNP